MRIVQPVTVCLMLAEWVSVKVETASALVRAVAAESRSVSPPTSLPRTTPTVGARLPWPTPAGVWSNVAAAGSIRQNG